MPPIKELTLASAISRLNRNHEDEAAQNFIRGLIGTKALLCVNPEGQLDAAKSEKSINFAKNHGLTEMRDRVWIGEWLRTKQARSEASPCTGLLLFDGETIDPSAPTENWTGVEMPKRWAIARARLLRDEKARDGESVSEAFRTGELAAAHKRWLNEWNALAQKVEKEIATDEELQLFQQAKNACYYRKGSEASAAADKSFREPEIATKTATVVVSGNISGSMVVSTNGPVSIGGRPPLLYIVCDPADGAWRDKIRKALGFAESRGKVEIFDDTQIRPGVDWRAVIAQKRSEAKVIAYLSSADLLASRTFDFREWYSAAPNAQHMPILVRPTLHQEAFMGLNCIPSNGKALSGWSNSDEAVQEVATVLRKELGI